MTDDDRTRLRYVFFDITIRVFNNFHKYTVSDKERKTLFDQFRCDKFIEEFKPEKNDKDGENALLYKFHDKFFTRNKRGERMIE